MTLILAILSTDVFQRGFYITDSKQFRSCYYASFPLKFFLLPFIKLIFKSDLFILGKDHLIISIFILNSYIENLRSNSEQLLNPLIKTGTFLYFKTKQSHWLRYTRNHCLLFLLHSDYYCFNSPFLMSHIWNNILISIIPWYNHLSMKQAYSYHIGGQLFIEWDCIQVIVHQIKLE